MIGHIDAGMDYASYIFLRVIFYIFFLFLLIYGVLGFWVGVLYWVFLG